jgi:hypothetical protein
MRRHLLRLLVVAGLLIAALPASGEPLRSSIPLAPGPNGIIDIETAMADPDCDTASLTGPAAVSTGHLTEDKGINLDVLVLVDFAEGAKIAKIRDRKARAAAERKLFAKVRSNLLVGAESYKGLDIILKLDRFGLLMPLEDGAPRERTKAADKIIRLAKEQLNGQRPKGVDVVYVLTDLDIELDPIGSGVAGLADCIGGVAFADRAFAVGEAADGAFSFGPTTFYKDGPAKILAHEIGHLMGGQHHYQECGTAAAAAVARNEPGPCTIMTNFVDFQTMPFSTLNGAVVRGHAEEWAR